MKECGNCGEEYTDEQFEDYKHHWTIHNFDDEGEVHMCHVCTGSLSTQCETCGELVFDWDGKFIEYNDGYKATVCGVYCEEQLTDLRRRSN